MHSFQTFQYYEQVVAIVSYLVDEAHECWVGVWFHFEFFGELLKRLPKG